jgi:hypothetical protein
MAFQRPLMIREYQDRNLTQTFFLTGSGATALNFPLIASGANGYTRLPFLSPKRVVIDEVILKATAMTGYSSTVALAKIAAVGTAEPTGALAAANRVTLNATLDGSTTTNCYDPDPLSSTYLAAKAAVANVQVGVTIDSTCNNVIDAGGFLYFYSAADLSGATGVLLITVRYRERLF